MRNEWKSGDLVRHKTGGPKMCVSVPMPGESLGGGMVACRWFPTYSGGDVYLYESNAASGPRGAAFHVDELEAAS